MASGFVCFWFIAPGDRPRSGCIRARLGETTRVECISCGKPRVFFSLEISASRQERRLFQCGTENIEFQCGEPLFSEDFTVTSAEHADFDLQKEFFKRFVVWRLFCIKLLSTSFVVAAELTCQKTRLFLDDIERMRISVWRRDSIMFYQPVSPLNAERSTVSARKSASDLWMTPSSLILHINNYFPNITFIINWFNKKNIITLQRCALANKKVTELFVCACCPEKKAVVWFLSSNWSKLHRIYLWNEQILEYEKITITYLFNLPFVTYLCTT